MDMLRPITKFFGEQSTHHRGTLLWPGIHGLPFRSLDGTVPVIGKDNINRVYYAGDACHAVFDLSDDEQAQMYCWVRDRIRNGWFILDYIERHWDPDKRNMVIYMEWTQPYTQMYKQEQQ